MGNFRRFIIALADIVSVLAIGLITILGGTAGAKIGGLYSYGYGQSDQTAVGFLLGALLGFFISALGAAFLFTLSEIAANTRALLVAHGGGGLPLPKADPILQEEFEEGSSQRFRKADAELNPTAVRVLKVAKAEGYEISMPDEATITITRGMTFINFVSNKQITTFGRKHGWV